MTSVIINGASGKMGQLACHIVESHADFELVASLGRKDSLKKAIKEAKADIVIDVTIADVAFDNCKTIIESGAHPIIGTSGLTESDIKILEKLAEKHNIGGIIVPNFSIGAVLMMQFSLIAAQYFPHAEIIEKHHENKKDAPSGTSIRTAELIASVRDNDAVACQGNHYNNINGIPIHSLRQKGFLASQDVVFGNTGETLTLSHNSINRDCFSEGILLCLEKVMSLDHLVCGLEHLL